MSNQIEKKVKHKKKKIAAITIAVLLCAFIAIYGVVAAFYSDIVQESGEITAGTLKIQGTYNYSINGADTSINGINNLNPGDVILVKGTISNNGNKSAWIRDFINFSSTDSAMLPYLNIYNGEFTQADFASQTDLSDKLLELSEEGKAVTSNKVINGSGANAEVESGEDYNYLNASTYQVSLTIYFLPTATNETQGKKFGITIGAQALQYRNNNISEPDETAWNSVSAV